MKKGTLNINGTIGQPDAFMEAFGMTNNVSLQWVKDEMAKIKEKEVEVHITSNGGSCDEGFAIHDYLKTCGKKITTIATGYVKSIATVIFSAGETRLISPNADFMVHNPYVDLSFTGGLEAADLKKLSEDVQKQEDKLANFYSGLTGRTVDEVKAKMKVETTMTADEAIDFGFATGKHEAVKALAYLNTNPIYNKMNTEIKSELTGMKKLLADIAAKFKGEATEVKNMSLTLKDGSKATTDSDQALAIGHKVTKEDGTLFPAGDITLEDETVVTLDADGIVTAIVEKEADTADADAKALKDKITALEKENKELKDKAAADKVKADALAKDVADMKASIQELSAFASNYKPKNEKQQFRKTSGNGAGEPVANAVEAARAARKAREEAAKKK